MPTSYFGAHSTRGAAVKMFKSLGLLSELVCELRGWKNATAFTAHYLRLGASEHAGSIISNSLVHKVPSCESDEGSGSCSPATTWEPGRSDLIPEERKQDGTYSFAPALFFGFWLVRGVVFLTA